MSVGSRRAGIPREQARLRPLYARILGLQYLSPSGFLCFVFFEGAVALGILLALAELVSWWGVLVLPLTVALMVKLNDVVAGALTPTTARAGTSRVRAGASTSAAGSVRRPTAGGTRRPPAGRSYTITGSAPVTPVPQAPLSPAAPMSPAAPISPAVQVSPASSIGPTVPISPAVPFGAPGPATREFQDAPDDPRVFGAPGAGHEAPMREASMREASMQDAPMRELPTVEVPTGLTAGRASWPASGGAPAGRLAGHAEADAPLNGARAARTRADRDDQVDNPSQWARQSGSRRYQ